MTDYLVDSEVQGIVDLTGDSDTLLVTNLGSLILGGSAAIIS
jgi:hypothetical protein